MNRTTEQQRVLDHLEGHLHVLAGPGSGKTHTLIEKVFYIFDQQIIPEPYGLLAITFSNAAVTEIHKRLWDKSFRRWDRISVRTFHSFAMHLLRCYGKDVGVREDFGVIDRDERLRLLDKLLLKHTSNMRRSDFDSWIQSLKRQGIYPECNERYAQPGERRFQAAYGDFQDNLFSTNKLDFDDLIYFAIKLVRESALVNGRFTRYFRYVIVDAVSRYGSTTTSIGGALRCIRCRKHCLCRRRSGYLQLSWWKIKGTFRQLRIICSPR